MTKFLKNINSQIEGLTSAVKNKLSFNKMIETQLAEIGTTIPVVVMERFLLNLRILMKM
jgi:hypothetical protein